MERREPPPLLSTRFRPPPTPAGFVERPRLLERFGPFRGGALVLVSAPAGFGKTTATRLWSAGLDARVAWLSLDGEDDAVRFGRYLDAALRAAGAPLGVEPPTAAPLATTVARLVNDLSGAGHRFVLVLDDYHAIRDEEVHDQVARLLEHLPDTLQLVLVTRESPPLPLSRLRVRGRVIDVHADALRFTLDEAERFLNVRMGLGLDRDEVARLERRAEGWIAALQLAALALTGRGERESLLAGFGGGHRLLADYLVEEVLERQPAEVRRFLLRTSVLERFCAGLCDAVTGEEGSQAVLERLERANLFLVPLDEERRWYRYHHLFGELLRRQLERSGDDAALLHRRAAAWFEAEGSLAEAIQHAFAARDFARAVRLLGLVELEQLFMQGGRALVWSWLNALPRDLVADNAEFSLFLAATKLGQWRLDEVVEHLADVERLVAGGTVPEGERVSAVVAGVRQSERLMRGDYRAVRSLTRQALDTLPPSERLSRSFSLLNAALADVALGRVREGIAALEAARQGAFEVGNLAAYAVATRDLAALRVAQGRLRTAEAELEGALAGLERRAGGGVTPYLLTTTPLGALRYERGRLDDARALLERGLRAGLRHGVPYGAQESAFRLGLLALAQGRTEEARAHADTLAALVEDLPETPLRRIAGGSLARLLLGLGRTAEAERWVPPWDDAVPPSPLDSAARFARARVLLALGRFARAEEELTRELMRAEEGGLAGDALEARTLLGLSQFAQGGLEPALTLLEPALRAAEPAGYLRLFADEGEPMAALLRHAVRRGVAPRYARRLLAACGAAPGTGRHPEPGAAHEPLSPRELEVLSLIAEGLSNKQIARRLRIAAATVKRHSVNLYGKLGVGSRTQAVARASELDLL